MKTKTVVTRIVPTYPLICLIFFLAIPLSNVLAQVGADSLRARYPEFKVFGNPVSDQDKEAVWKVMEKLGEGWRTGDAGLVASCYAADAEWTNAFGNVEHGRENIQKYHQWFFKEFNLGNANTDAENDPAEDKDKFEGRGISIRYLGDDVAVSHGLTFTAMGKAAGKELRKIHTTYVLAKQDGKWEIVHQMIMDERE